MLAFHPEGEAGQEIEALVPFLAKQRAADGRATAYVCVDYVCQLPTTAVEKLIALLEQKK